jgi:hypothetical protein
VEVGLPAMTRGSDAAARHRRNLSRQDGAAGFARHDEHGGSEVLRQAFARRGSGLRRGGERARELVGEMQTLEERRAVAFRGLAKLSDAFVDERDLDLPVGHADRERDGQQRADREQAEHTPRHPRHKRSRPADHGS